MFWPIILILLGTQAIGVLEDSDNSAGYPSKDECELVLPAFVKALDNFHFPIPRDKLTLIPGCVPMKPVDFFNQHVKPPLPGA